MQDVTASTGAALLLSSIALDLFEPPIAKRRLISAALLVAAAVVWWKGISLPLSRDVAWYLDLVVGLLWIVLFLWMAPRIVREIKASARE